MNKNYLKWKCRRGVLELDPILNQFFDKFYDNLSANDLKILENLLDQEDPLLLDWLIYNNNVPEDMRYIVNLIKEG